MNYLSIFKILIFSVLTSSLCAQVDFKAMPHIPLKTTWKKGESYQYELKKGKKNYIGSIEESNNETRQLVTLSVIESSPKGYIIEAEYNSAAYFLPDDLRKINGINVLTEKYSHTKVHYAISPLGEFLGILNGKDIQKMLVELFDAVESSKKITDLESTVLNNMRCQMTSEVYVTEGMFQELRLLHQFYGNEYQHDTPQTYDTQLANMLILNGEPIDARASLKVSVKDGNYCLFEHQLVPNAATMKKLTFEYFSKMSGGTWKAAGNTEGLELRVVDDGTFAYHLRSGWLVEMLKKRTTTLEDEKTIEYISMKLLEKGTF